MEKFKIKCLTCGNDNPEKITSYICNSNESIYPNLLWCSVNIRCDACQTFASTESDSNPLLEFFEVSCISCNSRMWSFNVEDVPGGNGPTKIVCDDCKSEESV